MRTALIANCQGESLGVCLTATNPALRVDVVREGIGLAEPASNYDLIIYQGNLWSPESIGFRGRSVCIPVIAFDGFHPDMTFVRAKRIGSEVEVVYGPMHSYCSIIAASCYKLGISLEDTVGFYNNYVFARLGYFDAFGRAKRALFSEGDKAGMPLSVLLNRWERSGCFMYSFNHPDIRVLADVAREALAKVNVEIVYANVERYLPDPLRDHPIWPIYPAIAERLGLAGDYGFRLRQTHPVVNLRDFVEISFRAFSDFERESIELMNYDFEQFREQLGFTPIVSGAARQISGNPYRNLPKYHFWRESVASVPAADLDPVINPKFRIAPTERVATAGSCFAQHIARTLKQNGFNYFVSESAPSGCDASIALKRNFGVFSARYGNIYTVRQLWQLIRRMQGAFVPEEQNGWLRKDGRLIDPFRPQIEPEGFADTSALIESREMHFAATRQMFAEMDVLVFTLGLTEGWQSRHDGAVFPLAPGVAGGEMDFARYDFVNFGYQEICDDLDRIIDFLKVENPKCRLMLTVSPVPLIATYEPRHALVATTYSKSVLRAAAETASRAHIHVEYFPSYEIITGAYNHGAYYDDDLRTVKDEGVNHVMRMFMKHYAGGQGMIPVISATEQEDRRKAALFNIVCEEESIVNFSIT